MPFVLLFVAERATFIVANTRRTASAIGVALVALLLLHPIASESFRLVVPRGTQEVRPVLRHITSHWSDEDYIYVYNGARKAFAYYADRFQLDEYDYVIGSWGINRETGQKDLNIFIADLEQLRGKDRVWFLFSNADDAGPGLGPGSRVDEELFFIHYLDNMGTRLDSFKEKNPVVYLYDLSGAGAVNAGSVAQ